MAFISQIHHRYAIHFDIAKDLLPRSEEVTMEMKEPPNKQCRLVGIEAKDDKEATIRLELLAVKDKLQKDELTLIDKADPSKRTTLVLQARVLGKGKGTPMLKEGVQMIEVLPDPDQSDVNSDWKGF